MIAMNMVWCTIMYNNFQRAVVRLLMLACICELLLFLLFVSSLCTDHNFSCQGGLGSHLCICACIMWALSVVMISKGRAISIRSQTGVGDSDTQSANASDKVARGPADGNASISTYGDNPCIA